MKRTYVVGGVMMAFIIFLVILWVFPATLKSKTSAERKRLAEVEKNIEVRPPTPIIKIGLVAQLYEFKNEPTGCVVRMMTSHNFWVYPKGGPVLATPPGGDTYTDTPGIDLPDRHYPVGTWRWCPGSKSSTGVQIAE